MSTTTQILIGAFGSVVATVVVLLTRVTFYKVRDLFPARALFQGIVGSEKACLVFVLRMTDKERKGTFLAPVPKYAVASSQAGFEGRQLVPWVTSTSETQAVAHLLNVLGRAGRTEDIRLAYVGLEFDTWDAPMFIVGGSWKATRAFETCDPYFRFQDDRFIMAPTGDSYQPQSPDEDLGLMHKMVNPSTGLPVWVAMGWRGAGTIAASYALARWWKEFGLLFGRKRFAILVGMNDRDGWQQLRIRRIHPEPIWTAKLLHPLAWRTLRRALSQAG